MKKTLAIVLVLFVLAAGSVAALADATVYTEGTMYYTVGDGTITIVGCFGKNESITVPNSIGGIPVNTIASGAFAGNKYLKTVYLPDTITSVEGGAFGGGVAVVYNYNVTEPVATPPATEEEEEIEIVPSVEVTPPPVEEQTFTTGSGTSELEDEPSWETGDEPAGNTGYSQNAGISYASGEADLDEDEDLLGTVVLEGDVDLDEEEEAEEEPAVTNTPEPVKTAEPVQPAAPTEKPEVKSAGRTETEKAGESFPLLTILLLAAWVIVLVTIIILLRYNAKRKAQMRRAARARARARRPEDSDTDR